jgi:outer membrane lipopolysaccharide assembly protein LptE/RlpB
MKHNTSAKSPAGASQLTSECRIKYLLPPDRITIRKFAQNVCQIWQDTYEEQAIEREVFDDFASLVERLAIIEANRRNTAQGEFDDDAA